MLKGALVGFGQIAEKAHAPAFAAREDFSITAVADDSPQRLKAAKACLPGIRTYRSFEDLLESETALDFIDIATPPFLHARQVLQGLSRGLHVLCEKPLTLDPKEFAQIQELAQKRNLTVFTVHNWKHAPIFLKLSSLLGAIGTIDHVELHALREKPAATALTSWRTDAKLAGGGILVDHGWHNLYLIHHWLGQFPRHVTARLASSNPGSAEEEAAVFLEFPSASALMRLSWLSPYRANWGVLYGRQGTLEIQDDKLLLRQNGKTRTFRFVEKLSAGSAHPQWFKSMLEDFKGEVLSESARGKNLQEAEFCLESLAHAYESFKPEACAR